MRTQGWAELYAWQLDRKSSVPLARQIYMQVRLGVLAGVLAPGIALPSTRVIARKPGVARASVVAAYEQLLAGGLCRWPRAIGDVCLEGSGRPHRRSPRRRSIARAPKRRSVPAPAQAFAEFAQSTAQADERPFNTGRTLVDARTIEIWRKLTHQAVRSLGPQDLGYTDPCGFIELRRSLCDYLRTARAVRCQPEQIVITSGTQHAIDIAIRVSLAPGDEVWVEDPGYFLTHRQLLLAKTRLRPIPVDVQGFPRQLIIPAAARLRDTYRKGAHTIQTRRLRWPVS